MTTTTVPAYVLLFFLIALGGLVPQYPMLVESEIVMEGAPKEGLHGMVDSPSPMSDISALINNNALEVSRLVHLYQNFLNFLTETPCLENYFRNNVSSVMADGFKEAAETFKEVQYSFALLQLLSWRISFVKSFDIPEIHEDRPCPLPFFMLDGECIYLEGKVKRPFKSSKLACDLMGGFLAEPANISQFAEHVEKMTQGRNGEVFIGLQSRSKDDPWQWTTNGEQINEDLEVDTSNVDDDEPICLTIKDSKYIGLPCLHRRMYACEIALPTEAGA
ncbi:uncharacterized protein [Palaemon carinicauda]|uniref:uncharacterized protein n=1 Tax=Palaemon carinicauda TaxID=392227 RepID=UPI0035B5BD79